MIGTQKLEDIKRELRLTLEKTDKDLQVWLDQQISKLQRKNGRGANVLEDLLWVRAILREAVAAKKLRRRKVRKPKTKRSPTAP
jgi:hypothetical protein